LDVNETDCGSSEKEKKYLHDFSGKSQGLR